VVDRGLVAKLKPRGGDHGGGDALFRLEVFAQEEGGAGAIRGRDDEEKVSVGRKYRGKKE
jgi:hypothetical protein